VCISVISALSPYMWINNLSLRRMVSAMPGPTVTFPAAATGHRYLMSEAHECEQRAKDCYLTVEQLEIELTSRPFKSQARQFNRHLITGTTCSLFAFLLNAPCNIQINGSAQQETVGDSGIIWTVCKTAPCFRQISMQGHASTPPTKASKH